MSAPAPLILVVEDEPSLRRDLIEELEEADYRTLAAPDGDAARDLLADAAPDLVLCDITMPRLDGFGLLSALRDDHRDLATTPFVFLTAMSDPQEVIAGKLRGADDYLVKPVDYDLLLATVDARLRQVARIREQQDLDMAQMRRALAGLTGSASEQALDLIALGIVLIDADGTVRHANRTARDMGTTAEHVTLRRGTLWATDAQSDKALQAAIAETLKAAATGTDAIRGVLLQGGDQPISTLVCPLGPGPHARVATFLAPLNQVKQVSEPLLIEMFDLTPTEARVAARLTRGARLAEVARELGVSQTTISFHMRNLFQKTGTNRQTDLVAMVLSGLTPVQTL